VDDFSPCGAFSARHCQKPSQNSPNALPSQWRPLFEAALRSNLADVLHQPSDKTVSQVQIQQSVVIYAVIGQAHDGWQAKNWQLTEW